MDPTSKKITYNLFKILDEVNGESNLIPYWLKLDLHDRGVPVKIDVEDIKNDFFEVESGSLSYHINKDMRLVIVWKK